MAELLEYKDKIYDILHPEIRKSSENDAFSSVIDISDDARKKGFMRVISDMFSEIMYKQKKRIGLFTEIYRYEEISKESIEMLYLEMLTSNVMYDAEVDRYYVYYRNRSSLDYSNLFDESWILYDNSNIFGIDRIMMDIDKMETENDFNYYYRIYVGNKSPSFQNYYVLAKPNILYYVGMNKGMMIHLLNSSRCNISLMKNAPFFLSEKGSLDNLKNIMKSLEGKLTIEAFTSINDYYESLLSSLSEEVYNDLIVKYSYNVKNIEMVSFLLKGLLYALRFEDFRIDFLEKEKSFIITDTTSPFIIKHGINEEIVKEEMIIQGGVPDAGVYDSVIFDSSGITVKVKLSSIDSIFFKRIGELTRWFFKVDYNNDEYVYKFSSLSLTSMNINIRLEPLFDIVVHQNDIEPNFLSTDITNRMFYYEYYHYPPVSSSTKFINLYIEHEINSSALKIMFNLAEYNKKVLSSFYPSYYRILRNYEEYNGERSLF